MSKINNLDFAALNVSGDNYLQWPLDTKIILKSKGLDQYLIIENPLDLWNALRQRYDHQKTILLPKARQKWKNLRIQNFKSVDQYNSTMFKIVSKLKLCGEDITEEDMLEKNFSTFHTSNVLLQQQYRAK
ncbi:hypothetical protein Bca4012_055837 [Brassica carinata]